MSKPSKYIINHFVTLQSRNSLWIDYMIYIQLLRCYTCICYLLCSPDNKRHEMYWKTRKTFQQIITTCSVCSCAQQRKKILCTRTSNVNCARESTNHTHTMIETISTILCSRVFFSANKFNYEFYSLCIWICIDYFSFVRSFSVSKMGRKLSYRKWMQNDLPKQGT